jgi:hypothetical protein
MAFGLVWADSGHTVAHDASMNYLDIRAAIAGDLTRQGAQLVEMKPIGIYWPAVFSRGQLGSPVDVYRVVAKSVFGDTTVRLVASTPPVSD